MTTPTTTEAPRVDLDATRDRLVRLGRTHASEHLSSSRRSSGSADSVTGGASGQSGTFRRQRSKHGTIRRRESARAAVLRLMESPENSRRFTLSLPHLVGASSRLAEEREPR